MNYRKNLNRLLCGVNVAAMVPAVADAKPADTKKADDRPNVLLIAIDDMKPWIGPYGDPIAKTPAMDALASRATTFNNAFFNCLLAGDLGSKHISINCFISSLPGAIFGRCSYSLPCGLSVRASR